ncbi:uncharacterized protein LDX57_003779 [Aspergillus melleus]|uniref:uncharacterized protein n=1 Tax=Aspergillus melleus TaxID=138277 RepID=UPI001E8D6FAF|nr:uncharacterized protein LDX57_003779 [Aspergillus melleus]KAH8426039.1 hypothetical protein LDX57_003779 [Aspergillus melleus]
MEIVDAIVALRSRGLYADIPSNKEKIYALLDQWRRHKEIRHLNLPSAKNFPDKPVDLDEIIRLTNLHKIMKFCLNDFCSAVHRPVWIEPEEWKNDVLPICLSRTEKTRFLRGLYRVQIYANIFGNREFYPGQKEPSQYKFNDWEEEKTFEPSDVWRLFISAMAPWEFQEYGCVWQYIYERYKQPYKEVADYFDQFESMPLGWFIAAYDIDPLPTNCTIIESDNLSQYQNHNLACLATMGPMFFCKFIREPCFLHRRDLIVIHWRFMPWHFGEMWESLVDYDMYPLLYPGFESADDFKETESLWATLSPTDRPNIACERLWFTEPQRYWSIYSVEAGGEEHWKWGFAIWDDERLIEWKRQLSTPLSTPYTTEYAVETRKPSQDYIIFTGLPS